MKHWVSTIQNKLATEKESKEGGMKRVIEALCDGLTNRVGNVQEAIDYKRSSPQACMSPGDFDNFSTPSRDHRIFDDFITLRDQYIEALKNHEPLSESMKRKMAKIYPDTNLHPLEETKKTAPQVVDEDSLCPFTYARGKTIDLAEAKRRMFLGKLSSDPNHSLGRRWGESNPEPDRGDNCKSEKMWKPFE